MNSSLIKTYLFDDQDDCEEDNLNSEYSGVDNDNGIQEKSNQQDNQDNEEVTSTFGQNVPEDKYNLTYMVFYLLGTTTMLPWNFFLTAEDYWLYKFRNVTNPNSTELTTIQKSFTSDLSISASIPGTIFLIMNAVFGHLISLKMKMIGSMYGILILFIVTTGLVDVDTDNWQTGFFILTMIFVIIMNSFSAVLSGALFGIAGLFPSEYMTAVVSGQALGGIFTALAMIISLTFGMNAQITALVYFNIGNVSLIVSIVAYILMSRSAYFSYFVVEKSKNLTESTEKLTEITNSETPEFMTVLKKIHWYAFSEFCVFAVTLSVYPAVTVLVQSQHHGYGHLWNDIYFVPVANYLTFNSGDYLGRILAGAFEQPKNKPIVIVILTLLRVIYIPILMMANLSVHNRLPVIVHSDIAFICLISIFSITNGYFANISLIIAPKVVMQHEKELASSIMAACLGLGLCMGSALSLILVQML